MNDALHALQGITERMIVRKEGPLGWIVFNQPLRQSFSQSRPQQKHQLKLISTTLNLLRTSLC
jgi:hypothetical protein